MKLSTAHKIGRFFRYFVLILVGVIMIYAGLDGGRHLQVQR